MVGDPRHRGEDRVDGDDPDRLPLPLVPLRRAVAPPDLDRQLGPEGELLVQGGDMVGRVHDLDGPVGDDVPRRDLAHLLGFDPDRLGLAAVGDEEHLLQVEDDLGDVLDDSLDRVELVEHPGDLHGGDRGALDRGEEDPAQGVAHRVPVAALERFSDEPRVGVLLGLRIHGQPLGHLELRHSYNHISTLSLSSARSLRVELHH